MGGGALGQLQQPAASSSQQVGASWRRPKEQKKKVTMHCTYMHEGCHRLSLLLDRPPASPIAHGPSIVLLLGPEKGGRAAHDLQHWLCCCPIWQETGCNKFVRHGGQLTVAAVPLPPIVGITHSRGFVLLCLG